MGNSVCAVFAEKGIDGLQHQRLHAGGSLRNLGLHPQLAVKVEVFLVQSVLAVECHLGSGDGEGQAAKADHAVVQHEVAFQLGHAAARVLVFRLALRLAAQGLDFGRHFGAGELCLLDVKFSVQIQPVGQIALARRQIKFGVKVYGSGQRRLVGLHRQAQQVFDPAVDRRSRRA